MSYPVQTSGQHHHHATPLHHIHRQESEAAIPRARSPRPLTLPGVGGGPATPKKGLPRGTNIPGMQVSI